MQMTNTKKSRDTVPLICFDEKYFFEIYVQKNSSSQGSKGEKYF